MRTYAYLLGLYLGDGCISKDPRKCKLRIVLDVRYPGIIDEASRAIAAMRPAKPGRLGVVRKVGCMEVYA